MTDKQYIEFLENEIEVLEEWLSQYRKAYNRLKTMREPSREFYRLAKWLNRLKWELKGFYPE